MKLRSMACVAVMSLCGCASLEISTLTHAQVQSARKASAPLAGYVVYEPMVVVEVSVTCVLKDDKGLCVGPERRCAAGKPFLLPDYTKPYLLSSKPGFGKSGVEITIVDGWMLGSIKDNSDNTAVLGVIAAAFGLSQANMASPGGGCAKQGLYRVHSDGEKVTLEVLQTYLP